MNNLWEYAKWIFYGGWVLVTIVHYIFNEELYQKENAYDEEDDGYPEYEYPYYRNHQLSAGILMSLCTLHWDILESDHLKLKNKKRNANLWSLIFIFYTILVPFVWCLLHAARG